uniref:Uncharacterized protein n=1 Tax=Oryzias melastigma TaxID=30732 RepID=A0A3B3BS43_ORYME
MHGHQQGWRGDKDELQAPQADVRHRKEVVIADIFASRLLGVAGEVRLLVPPNALCSQNQDGNAEDEENRQPDLPQTGGVFVDSTQQDKKCVFGVLWSCGIFLMMEDMFLDIFSLTIKTEENQ